MASKLPLQNLRHLGLELQVNSIPIEQVGFQMDAGRKHEVELVIRDTCLGCFTVHEGFDFQLRAETETEWRSVTVGELKQEVISRLRPADTTTEPREDSLITEETAVDYAEGDINDPLRIDSELVRRTTESLYRAGIPYVLEASLRTSEGHRRVLVIGVRRLLQARICLRLAGFRQHPHYKTILYDPGNQDRVRLIERTDRQERRL